MPPRQAKRARPDPETPTASARNTRARGNSSTELSSIEASGSSLFVGEETAIDGVKIKKEAEDREEINRYKEYSEVYTPDPYITNSVNITETTPINMAGVRKVIPPLSSMRWVHTDMKIALLAAFEKTPQEFINACNF